MRRNGGNRLSLALQLEGFIVTTLQVQPERCSGREMFGKFMRDGIGDEVSSGGDALEMCEWDINATS